MGCGCSKNRATAAGAAVVSGTWRVIVNGRKQYETTNEANARKVAGRYKVATILAPGENA